MALLVLRRVGLCVGQNQMCHLCGWLKLFLKNVRWAKIKIQKCWLSGRLSDGSFVPSLYVYFCRSFLLCRLLGLQVTVWVLPKAGIFSTKVQSKNEYWTLHKYPIEAVQPRFWQYLVSSRFYSFVCQKNSCLLMFVCIPIWFGNIGNTLSSVASL